MEQYGVVIEERGDRALISLQRHLACANCGRCGILSGSNKRELKVEVLNPINAEKGRRVILESDDRRIIFISFMLYLVPLGGLVAGILSWQYVAAYFGLPGEQDLAAAAAGIGLMAVVFLLIRIWDRRVKDDPSYKPVITALIETEDEDCHDR